MDIYDLIEEIIEEYTSQIIVHGYGSSKNKAYAEIIKEDDSQLRILINDQTIFKNLIRSIDAACTLTNKNYAILSRTDKMMEIFIYG